MGWTIVETVVTFIEYWIYADFMVRFLKPKTEKTHIIAYILICLLNATLTLIFNYYILFEGVLGVLRIGMNFVLSLILLKGNLFEKLFASFITDAIVLVINYLTLNILCHLFAIGFTELMTDRGTLRLLTLFITKFLFYIATRILIRFKQKDHYTFHTIEWVSLVLVFFITMFVEIEIFKMAYQFDVSTESPTAIGAGVGLIAINILVYFLMRRISHANAEKTALLIDKMQLELYQSQLLNSEKKYREVRQIQHDMKNHLQCISLLLQEKETMKAQTYIADMMRNRLNFGYAGVKTGHHVVDVIANTKLSQCTEEQIEIAVNISPFALEMDDIDICIILGNLFDNAIEACRAVEGDRFIYFEMAEYKGYVKLLIRNSVNGSVLENNPELKTTKKEKRFHGVGLKSVKDTVRKYGGMIDFYEQNQEFTVDVWLPRKNDVNFYHSGKFHAE